MDYAKSMENLKKALDAQQAAEEADKEKRHNMYLYEKGLQGLGFTKDGYDDEFTWDAWDV